MNLSNLYIKSFLYSIAITSIVLFGACGSSTAEKTDKESASTKAAEEEHHDENASITSLTTEQMTTVGVRLGKIEHKPLSASIKANGVLRVPNFNKAHVTPLFGGVIKSLKVQTGDWVVKGQVIASIENPQFIQVQEEYLSIDSRINFANQELQRQKMLNEGNAGALKNQQSADAELKTLRTRKASLQRQIQLMGFNPASLTDQALKSSLTISSPINGTVSTVFANLGSYVDVSSPILEVVDNSQLQLELQIFEKDISTLKKGQKIQFTTTNNPNKTYSASIENIGASFNNESKTIAVRAQLVGDKTGLIDGMNTVGFIHIDAVESQVVPNEALLYADGKTYIFIVTDKEAEEHSEEEAAEHNHAAGESHNHNKETKGKLNFEKIEIIKGNSELGYTGITLLNELPAATQVVISGAFFMNAKLSNTGGHAH